MQSLAWEITDKQTSNCIVLLKDLAYPQIKAFLAMRDRISLADVQTKYDIRCIASDKAWQNMPIADAPNLDGFSHKFYVKFHDLWQKGLHYEQCMTIDSAWHAFLCQIADLRHKFSPDQITYAFNRNELEELRSLLPLYADEPDLKAPPMLNFDLSHDAQAGVIKFSEISEDELEIAYQQAKELCFKAGIKQITRTRFRTDFWFAESWQEALASHIAYWQTKTDAKCVAQDIEDCRAHVSQALQGKNIPSYAKLEKWKLDAEKLGVSLIAYSQGHIEYWSKRA